MAGLATVCLRLSIGGFWLRIMCIVGRGVRGWKKMPASAQLLIGQGAEGSSQGDAQ